MPFVEAETASDARREIKLTRIAITGTVGTCALAAAAAIFQVCNRLAVPTWSQLFASSAFVFVVVYLIYGSLVYQVSRLGYYTRLSRHRRASDADLLQFYRHTHVPAVTVLVPAYKEEVEVVRKTLLSAAFQTYPNRRIVLLIDDPPRPTTARDAACLSALRHLPAEIEELLRKPREASQAAFAAFLERRRARRLDLVSEWRQLSALYDEIAAWFDSRALEHAVVDHVDRHFVELTYRTHAEHYRQWGRELAHRSGADPNEGELFAGYRRLTSAFDVSLSSFERKRYANLSHEPNKAMNLNSYIGLMGRSFCESGTASGDESILLERDQTQATLSVPDADYVLMVDADSVLHPEYTIRLIHFMEEREHERVAVAQTPYSAFPDAPGVLERLAGATTDIQYIIHQGFTRYDATFWVGANALVRRRALEDIAVGDVERGYPIRKFIQDRTVIEDTESSVDLIERGWKLYNYPERLAFSATPPDFGALIIQRRRWANGGLIVLPKLIRYLGRRASRWWLPEALMRCHYLTSLAVVNVGLLVVLAVPLGDGLSSFWLPLTAVPYYALYTRDLLRNGYRRGDIFRVYALNLLLIPISLSGVFKSLRQAVTGQKTPFGRTPKTSDPTRAPSGYVVAEYFLLAQWLLGASVEFLRGHSVHAALALTNAGFLAYAFVALIGLPGVGGRWAVALAEPARALRAVPWTLLGSVKTRWTVTTLMWFLAVVLAAPGVAATELAVTVDDIPANGPAPAGVARLDIASEMIRALERHSVPGVYGFTNGGQLLDHPEFEDILRAWRRAGFFLANHTLSHSDLTRLNAADYIVDIERNESILMRLSPPDAPKYFRYPYLHEGNTTDKREAVRRWLAVRGYTIAPVTISLDEGWAWNDVYVRCVALHDTQSIPRVKRLFLQSAVARLKAFEELSRQLFGRPIKHILLLHMSAFEALMLDELLTTYRAEGTTLVSLPEAMQDSVFRLGPPLVREQGATFLIQIAQSRHVPMPQALAALPEHPLCRPRSAQSLR